MWMLQEAYRCFVSLLQKWGLQRLYATDLTAIKVGRLLLPQPPLLDLLQLLTVSVCAAMFVRSRACACVPCYVCCMQPHGSILRLFDGFVRGPVDTPFPNGVVVLLLSESYICLRAYHGGLSTSAAGTLRMCPPQFHPCLSSSAFPVHLDVIAFLSDRILVPIPCPSASHLVQFRALLSCVTVRLSAYPVSLAPAGFCGVLMCSRPIFALYVPLSLSRTLLGSFAHALLSLFLAVFMSGIRGYPRRGILAAVVAACLRSRLPNLFVSPGSRPASLGRHETSPASGSCPPRRHSGYCSAAAASAFAVSNAALESGAYFTKLQLSAYSMLALLLLQLLPLLQRTHAKCVRVFTL